MPISIFLLLIHLLMCVWLLLLNQSIVVEELIELLAVKYHLYHHLFVLGHVQMIGTFLMDYLQSCCTIYCINHRIIFRYNCTPPQFDEKQVVSMTTKVVNSSSSHPRTPAPLPGAAPLPNSAPIPHTSAPLPNTAPIPPLSTPAPIPMGVPPPLGAPPPFGAPPPLGAPPHLGGPPLLPGPPLLGVRPIPRPKCPVELPPFQPITFTINDQPLIDKFLAQLFKTDKINEKVATFIASSSYEYLNEYSSRWRKSKNRTITKYYLPFIKQYELSNTLISDTKSINKSVKSNDIPINITCDKNKTMYFKICDHSINDAKQDDISNNEDDESSNKLNIQRIYKSFHFDNNKRNLLIVGSLSSDIGIYLNKQVSNGLEKDINDYMYPRRNRQIIVEIQWKKRMVTKKMLPEYRNIKSRNKLIKSGVDVSTKQTIIEILKKVMNIENHNAMFWKWKLRINDLVDPSLLACHYNSKKHKLNTLKSWKNNFWIPSVFRKTQNGNIEIMSDINNLSRVKYPKLYDTIASVFKKMLPSFEWVTGYNFAKEMIKYFRVVVKFMNYEIYPDEIKCYDSMLHREGDKDENIIAVGIYYYYKSNDIMRDVFEIKHQFKLNEYEKNWIGQTINVKQDNFIVFNNRMGYQHRVSELQKHMTTHIVKRKLLAFFLVDPKASKYKMEVLKTSKDIVVNLEDKLDLMVMNWARECVMNVSDDVINLIGMYTFNNMQTNYLKRDIDKMMDFIQDADNEYKNRPKPRKKN
eukprot:128910_1